MMTGRATSDEAGWLRNKTGATRMGFAVQLKFLTWRGRFPKMRLELPPDAVEHVAKQVSVAAAELGFYDFTSRAAKRHRSELRDLTGWHDCTTTDQVKLASQLVDVIWRDERRLRQADHGQRGATSAGPVGGAVLYGLRRAPPYA